MSEFVVSTAGDRIAYDRHGDGPALVFVAGAGPWRAIDPETTRTAERLAGLGVTAIVYDRVGRGESAADGTITLERELAAIEALIDAAGGSAVLCGHSSGCSISLRAAVAGLAVDGLALWEAPLAPPDSGGREWADEVNRLIDAGDNGGALDAYMRDMPPEILEIVRGIPAMIEQAPSLRPDGESLAWAESAPHAELFGGIRVPVLAMVGEQTYDIMTPAAESIAAAIPGATWKAMPGSEHGWEPESMAAELAAFVHAAAARRVARE
ncbi:alpha/beta fold hydrolase [Agromyces cerinus]|uniref:Pimeloyl-ACP methyl ester carboxylesterase n=1 Tax=Agromyces cerinus subsp. cerinus TaxID=232089 RepID=A0A1N6I3S0_9MICO|nr:alpha/beta hydrolase [Agromyces cerinus]SIO26668.1 Pimeloyl-ACP methyl ester carboxylesterase [Agromyces cerinus subsp. cerinus]